MGWDRDIKYQVVMNIRKNNRVIVVGNEVRKIVGVG